VERRLRIADEENMDLPTLQEKVRLGFRQLDEGKGIDSAEVYRRAEQVIEHIRRAKDVAS